MAFFDPLSSIIHPRATIEKRDADMRIAYGDLIGGISGDMFVAALLDLGLPLGKLKAELKKIPTLKFALKDLEEIGPLRPRHPIPGHLPAPGTAALVAADSPD